MIRPAGLADASAVGRVQVRAWHRMFADLVIPELTPTVEAQHGAWTEALAAGVEVFVAEIGGEVRGFAAQGPARDTDVAEGTGEIYGLYVDPVAQGAGVGGALLRAAVGALAFASFSSAVVWTPVENAARDWLVREGWFADTTEVAGHGILELTEIRHRRALP